MKLSKNRWKAVVAAFLLLALCACAFSGALADETQSIEILITQETDLLSATGKSQGTLLPGESGTNIYQPQSGGAIQDVLVIYELTNANNTEINDALIGKTKVRLEKVQADAAADPAAQGQSGESQTDLPPYGYIDTEIVLAALAAAHAENAAALKSKDEEIALLQNATPETVSVTPAPIVEESPKAGGIFSSEITALWLPIAALALGLVITGLIATIAINLMKARKNNEKNLKPIKTIAENLSEGITLKNTVKIEQVSWPKEGSVPISCDSLEQLTAQVTQVAQWAATKEETKEEIVVAPPPVPEGEEPELLELVNSLAGKINPAEWQDLIKAAGWSAVLLKTNPNEKGTYIIDEGGYSVIACLMRGEDAQIGYVLPSYMDANASEARWSEFYYVTEDMSVLNFHVDALPVMFVERGAFFLQKTMGRLTRRKQYS